MKTSLTLASILLFLAACDTFEPDPVAPLEADITLEELTAYAQKVADERPTALLVVGQAAYVYNLVLRDPQGYLSNLKGYQRATWYEGDLVRAWAHDCWSGSPTFPEADTWDTCGPATGPFTGLTAQEVLATTLEIIRAIAEVDGCQVLWSDLRKETEYQEYQIWYSDSSGKVFYWRWMTGTIADPEHV